MEELGLNWCCETLTLLMLSSRLGAGGAEFAGHMHQRLATRRKHAHGDHAFSLRAGMHDTLEDGLHQS
jgi:hypothetical protein